MAFYTLSVKTKITNEILSNACWFNDHSATLFKKFYNTDLHIIVKQKYIKENDDSVKGAY